MKNNTMSVRMLVLLGFDKFFEVVYDAFHVYIGAVFI